ncbi:PREDICTED: sushi, von Willebrand factor type A, EGF and pentraxin domain-containing protein 1-like [Thamnophis sirtalis]|uniref:Sushi, von Willebrand factor type A, EGF and pentraxin domain-containing protein 1-like n=1 Tax=Thamnophis sirtalis TaxID=35019 RepID=A0A6I9X9R9_9SAUR|nr:PREDICTED: sushi, von Willebrand factor type A, EGF and pentraxin domain-containing protein 1-like [Thamnophis sirtalis]
MDPKRVKEEVVDFARFKWPLLFSRFYEAFKFSAGDDSGFLSFLKGDLLILDQDTGENVMNSGWANGINERTKQKGDFPTDSVYVLPTMTTPPPDIVEANGGKLQGQSFTLATIKGDEYTFTSNNAEDIRDLVVTFLEGLRRRSKYVVTLQDNPNPATMDKGGNPRAVMANLFGSECRKHAHVPSFCNDVDDIDCRFEDLPQKHCLEYNYDYENGFAIGPGGWGAINRLDYSYDDFVEVDSEEQLPKLPSDSVDVANSRVKRHKKINTPMSDHKIKLIFNITATVPLPDKRNDSLEAENQQRLLKTLERITNRLKRTLNKHPMYSFQLSSELLIADINSLEAEKAFLFCKPGSVLRGRMCVNCPLGTYYSLEHHACESCWIGSYQDEEGQLECKNCPSNTYTEYLHSRSMSECKAQCKPGTSSPNGLEICESCPFGKYQPTTGSKNCLSCPENMSTVKRGAVDISACGGTITNLIQESPIAYLAHFMEQRQSLEPDL